MHRKGHIEVICGPMSSGKSLELIRRISRYKIADRNVLVLKPEIDTRDGNNIISREGSVLTGVIVVKDSIEALKMIETIANSNCDFSNIDLIAFDEAQFFDEGIVNLIATLAYVHDINIIVSGLEKDATMNPFGPMPNLLAIADEVLKLSAVCMKCKEYPANFTYKKNHKTSEQIEVGGDELYEARCFKCWLNS